MTPNTAAVRFNINTETRTLNNPSDDQELYSKFPRGQFDSAAGFTDLGGLVQNIGPTRIQDISNDGSFREPFDAFSFRVFVNQPVTDLVVGVNPGEATEATLLFGRDDPLPQDMVLIETDPALDVAGNGIANITINTTTPAQPAVNVSVNPSAVDEDGNNRPDLYVHACWRHDRSAQCRLYRWRYGDFGRRFHRSFWDGHDRSESNHRYCHD